MLRSLHMKLVLIMVLLVLSVMIVVGTLLVSRVTTFYLEDFSKQMESVFTTRFLTELTEEAVGDEAPERMRNMLNAYASALGLDDYRQCSILSGDGSFITGSDATAGAELKKTPNIIRAISGEVGDRLLSSAGYMDLAIPISGEDTDYIVYVRDSNEELTEIEWMLVKLIIQVLLFSMAFALLLSVLLSKTMTMPLENVTKGAAKLASGQLDSLLEVQSDDEIGKLTSTFNDMAQTLQETLEEVNGERNKLNTLFRHMTDGVVAFDRNQKILHMNPAAEEMLGISFSEELTYREVLGENAAAEITADLNGSVEYSRGEKSFQVFLAPLGGADKEQGTMAVIHDITQQQKLERGRREFVASVSHELRTPLTSIKSYTETLRNMPDLSTEERARFLEIVDNEADRMTRLVKDLLTLSRLDNNKFEMRISSFSIERLLKNIYDSMLFEAKNRSQELMLDLQQNMPAMTADRERVEQIVINILSNAIKYTPNGGKILLSGSVKEEEITIMVRDTGVGIPEGDKARIFERFYRVEKARSRDSGGTGLGLAIAGEMVRYHHGKIIVDSKVDVGTTVTVRLPLQYEEA